MDALSPNRANALAALGEPLRRELYRLVAAAPEPLGRDEAASALGIPRSTAAFHLDRLADAGLLAIEYRRLSGRGGPGAGRPAKLYSAGAAEVLGSMPERHYELAGELLAAAIERAEDERMPVRDALAEEAHAAGVGIGTASGDLEQALTACGYEPVADPSGAVLLENCPFHRLAASHTDLVCHANLSLVEGIVESVDDHRVAALEPGAGRCCVVLRGARSAAERAPA